MKKLSYPMRAIVEAVKFINEKSISEEKFARMCNESPNRVHAFLKGKAIGHVQQLGEKMLATVERERAKKESAILDSSFVQTSTASRIFDAIALGAAQRDIVVIYGESGCGKTMALRAWAAKNHDRAMLIEAATGYSPSHVFSKINDALGLSVNVPLYDLFENACKKLKDSAKVLITDEAENVNLRTLELMRRAHDLAGICVVLAGMPRLLSNLRGKRGEHSQLYSRVGLAVKIENINEFDAEKLVRAWRPEVGDLWPEFWKLANESARRLHKLCKMASHIADLNHMSISKEVIKRASEVLLS